MKQKKPNRDAPRLGKQKLIKDDLGSIGTPQSITGCKEPSNEADKNGQCQDPTF